DSLVIQINQAEGTRLVRVPLPAGPEQNVPSRYPLVGIPLAPNAVHSDGRIAVQVGPHDSWYWPAAILDPKTGAMEFISEGLADMNRPGWDDQGRVVVAAQFLRASLWRFRPEK